MTLRVSQTLMIYPYQEYQSRCGITVDGRTMEQTAEHAIQLHNGVICLYNAYIAGFTTYQLLYMDTSHLV